jgi:hypothetical protein
MSLVHERDIVAVAARTFRSWVTEYAHAFRVIT